MPTGTPIRDVRAQLFAAAERILWRDGPSALTSRAVTMEAGCAKGVLHRHFADFDAFLAQLVLDRLARLERDAEALQASAGADTVVGNLAAAVVAVFDPLAFGMLALVTSRRELLARLRPATPSGIPLMTEATLMIAAYLVAERNLGRLAPHADVDTLAPMLVGTAHLRFAGQGTTEVPQEEAVRLVEAVIGPALR